MKKIFALLYLTIIVLTGCGSGGGGSSNSSAATKVLSSYTICGTQLDSAGFPVVGATVSMVVNSIIHTTQTGNNGEYTLTIPANDAVNLPDSFTYSISKSGYVPVTYSGTKSNTNCQASVAMIIMPSDNSYVVLETPPLVHHLGDGIYNPNTEPPNSQFQYVYPEGIKYSKSFPLTDQPTRFTSATVTFVHKGIQSSLGFKDVLIINSQTYDLPDSNPDGSYTQFSRTFNSNIFTANQENTLTIQSGTTGSDYDDFEFQNIVIQFK